LSQASLVNEPSAGALPPRPNRRDREKRPDAGENAPALAIREGASFEGLLTCPKAARIDGHFTGDIIADDRIELGVEAEVSGRIEAREIVVAGRFEGELHASRSIELLATASVEGELCARELIAEEGCTVKGRCRTLPRD